MKPPKESSNKNGERSRRALGWLGAACFVAASVVLFQILWPLRWSLVASWLTVEIIFYIFYWRPRYAELDASPAGLSLRPATDSAMEAFDRMLEYFQNTKGGIDYEVYYSGWFLGAKPEDIKRGNAEEFLAYAFWYRTMQEMHDDGLGHVPTEMLTRLEQTWGLVLKPGYTPGLQFMGHLWEPLKAQWRPLAFYLSTAAVGWFATAMLKRWGFQQASHLGMVYFTLNMGSSGLPMHISQDISWDGSAASLSDVLAARTASTPSTSAAAPTACNVATSATALPATPCGPAAAAIDSYTSTLSSTLERGRSSPFVDTGLAWAAQLAKEEQHLAASLNVASAVPHQPEKSATQTEAVCTTASIRGCKQPPSEASAQADILASRLSAQTSMLLKSHLNPLEEALSEDLANRDMPVLFLHGVGGVPAYLEMLLQVMALGHPVIVVQCCGVSMRLGPVHTADQVVEQVVGVLDKLAVEQACVIGHSYGTFVAGRLSRLHPDRVRSLCLIDPVCFGMFMPQLLRNFLYTAPPWKGLHHFVDFMKQTGVYLASHELHVCATFSRGFFWTDLNLWPEDLAPGSVVLLSGRDDLMNAQQVRAMLEESGHIKVHYIHDLTHGEFLIKTEVKQAVIEEVRTMLRRGGSAVVGLAAPVLTTTVTLACNALGVGGAVRLHTADDGAKYVEDCTNKLVRTFTGNLTAVLHHVHSVRSTFDTARSGLSANSDGSSRSRLSVATGASSSASPSSSTAGSVLGMQLVGNRQGQMPPPKALIQALSLPIKSKPANPRQRWLGKVEQIIAEQAPNAVSAIQTNDSSCSEQFQDGESPPIGAKTISNGREERQSAPCNPPSGCDSRAVARKKSGSEARVIAISEGQELISALQLQSSY